MRAQFTIDHDKQLRALYNFAPKVEYEHQYYFATSTLYESTTNVVVIAATIYAGVYSTIISLSSQNNDGKSLPPLKTITNNVKSNK